MVEVWFRQTAPYYGTEDGPTPFPVPGWMWNRERGPQVEPGSSHHHRCAPGRQDLVDSRMGEGRKLPNGAIMLQRPDADQSGMARSLVREDRKTPVGLHGVRGHDLRGNPLGHSRRDSALAAGGGAEDRNHRANHDPAIVRFTEAALKKLLRRDLTLPGLLRRNHLERTHIEVAFFVAWSGGLALAALIGVAWVAGFGRVIGRLDEINPIWFAVAFGAEVLAYVGYILGYREVARVDEGPELGHGHTAAIVSTGFGAFVARGGFAVDMHAFRDAGVSEREARVRVLGLGALEYALLAPAACATAAFLVAEGRHRPSLPRSPPIQG